MNVPPAIGLVLSSRLASLVELDTVLGTEDLYNLLEIVTVDAYNKRIASKAED